METDETRLIQDALLGKDMEAYRKLDASLHPEQKPKKWSIGPPPEVTGQPRYKELQDEACDKSTRAGVLSNFIEDVAGKRRYWNDRAQGRTIYTDSTEAREFYGAAAAAVGHVIARAMSRREKLHADVSVAREAMAAMVREYYESKPEVFGKVEGGHV